MFLRLGKYERKRYSSVATTLEEQNYLQNFTRYKKDRFPFRRHLVSCQEHYVAKERLKYDTNNF